EGNYIGTNKDGTALIPGNVAWFTADSKFGATPSDKIVPTRPVTPGAQVGYATGKVGPSAFNFTGGPESSIQVSNSADLEPASAVTVEAWVKGSNPGIPGYLVGKGADGTTAASYALYTGGAGGPGLPFYGTTTTDVPISPSADGSIWDNNWHHVAGTYDGSHVRLYVDGVEVGTPTAATGPIKYNLSTTNDLFLGSYGVPGFNFTGALD